MSGETLYVRNVPAGVSDWLDGAAHSLRTSKTSFVISVLEEAMRRSKDEPGQLPISFAERALPAPPVGERR